MEAKQVRDLMEVYASIYAPINESHFKVGDEVVCKSSGMEGEVVKVDPEQKGKYYTVKREDGKTMKYAPDELKKEEEGASKEKETEFHSKLDKMVHKTFGEREEEKKMKEDVDLFDYLLEYLVVEGYADTNKAALAIIANMGEEWKQSIVEQDLTARQKYLIKKVGDMNAAKSGSAHTAIPGKQSAGGALDKANRSAMQMRGV